MHTQRHNATGAVLQSQFFACVSDQLYSMLLPFVSVERTFTSLLGRTGKRSNRRVREGKKKERKRFLRELILTRLLSCSTFGTDGVDVTQFYRLYLENIFRSLTSSKKHNC